MPIRLLLCTKMTRKSRATFKRVQEPEDEVQQYPENTNTSTNWVIIDWKKDYRPYFKKIQDSDLIKLKKNMITDFDIDEKIVKSNYQIEIQSDNEKKFTVLF